MKLKHRKLFRTNGTTDCSDFCDEPFGDFYYPQPPPPPSPSNLAVSDQNDNESHGVSASVVVLFALLASFLLLLLCYVVVSKSCLGLFRRRRRRRNHDDDLTSVQSDGRERDQFVDHHQNPIWLIATVGLQQPIINSITAVRYRKGEGLIEGSDCSVCLSEFREGDALRLLPKCSHAFHVSCIDTWLRSHTNCPLCRAHIVAEPPDHNNATGITVSSDAVVDEGASYSEVAEENDVVRSALRRSVSMGHNRSREEKFARMIRVSPVAMKKRSLSCGGRYFSRQSNDHDHLRSGLVIN